MAQRGRPTSTLATSTRPANPNATQALYGQCGGQTYTGPTRCPAGSYCKNIEDNIWYSQCVPNSDNAATSRQEAEIRTLTTRITIDGPVPTVISTQITYLQPRPPRTTEAPVEVVTVTLIPDEPCDHDWYCEKKRK